MPSSLCLQMTKNEGRGLLPWQHGNKVFTAKSHTMNYYCPKRHMYQMLTVIYEIMIKVQNK